MIKPLTSLRFVFALLIFLHHLSFIQDSNSDFLHWLYVKILWEGYIGVSFFFILSGFIIAYNYQEKFLLRKISFKNFIIARISRIYPLHILTLFFSIPLVYYSTSNIAWTTFFSHLLVNISLIQSFIPLSEFYFSFNGVSWSISNELFFYLCFPLLTFFISKLIKVKFLFYLCILVILLLLPVLMFYTPNEIQPQIFYINPILRVLDFSIGILLFNLYCFIKYKKFKFSSNFFEPLSVLSLILFFVLYPEIPQVLRWSIYYWFPMSFIILVFSFQKGILSRFLSHSIFVFLGEISFGFYMIHQLVIKFSFQFFTFTNPYIHIIILFSFSLLLSYISYKFFETPMNRYLKEKFTTSN